jgi:hypothetical protein
LLSNKYINHKNSSPLAGEDKGEGEEINAIIVALLTISFITINATDAFAYIDPNTGGYVFQLLFPIISVIGFAYLFLKRQIKLLFARIISFIKSVIEKIFVALGISRGNINKGSD